MPIRQEGDLCGLCNNPDTNFFCGNCMQGLECVFNLDGRISAPDMLESRCHKKTGNTHFLMLTII